MRCFSIIGPSNSGKSTLAKKLASMSGNSQELVSPAGVGLHSFRFMDDPWFLIDVPGSNEGLAYAMDALLVSDVAIVCVPPDPEQAVLAAPYLKAVEASGIPCMLFINRIDEPKGRMHDVVSSLQEYADHALILRQIPLREGDKIVGTVDLISERAWRFREGGPSSLIEIPAEATDVEHSAHEELLEHLSEYDDWLLEELIENREPSSDAVYSIASRVISESRVMPVLLGSASHGNGITRLMKALRHEAPDHEGLKSRLAEAAGGDAPDLACASFHAYYKPGIGKVVVTRNLSEPIKQGSRVGGQTIGAILDPVTEKPFTSGAVEAGQMFSAIKSDHLAAPALIGAEAVHESPKWAIAPEPMFEHCIEVEHERDEAKLSDTLRKLKECDPGLEYTQEEDSGALVLHVQGPQHLRHALGTLADVFKVPVREVDRKAIYRETITGKADVHYRHKKQSGGAGQFADVKLSARPNPRGTGFTFSETIKGGAVPRNFIPAVETGAREAMAKGPLGFKVIDVDVVLTDGQHHSVDSSDIAFKMAGMMGVHEALEKAAPVLMQPIYKIRCHIPSIYSGNLVPLVSSIKGQVLGFERDEEARGWDIFRALLPANLLSEFARSLRAETQGIGYFEKEFDHFEEIYGKAAEQIIGKS